MSTQDRRRGCGEVPRRGRVGDEADADGERCGGGGGGSGSGSGVFEVEELTDEAELVIEFMEGRGSGGEISTSLDEACVVC